MINNECFQGFIASKSPFSFKNPIFYSCPNNKNNFKKQIVNNEEMKSKKILF
jgi:hypothetical protein